MWVHSTLPFHLPSAFGAVWRDTQPPPPPTCAYFNMIRQLDNIKFALLLPEFVYGKRGEGVGVRSKSFGGAGINQHMARQPIPRILSICTNAIWCLARSPTEPILWAWLQLKWLKNIFQAILCAKEKANEFTFYHRSYPVSGGVVGDSEGINRTQS